ncbi:uncharacterized protein LOC141641231 [Silene latifolia]|uniref:uncharacterized protein LOC141641231 n=1 Tax=Silene latifolia TaxID=37657 RepID=UPI003D76F61D
MARNKRVSSSHSTSKTHKNNNSSTIIKSTTKISTSTTHNTNLSEPVSQVFEVGSSSTTDLRAFNLDKELESINEDKSTDDEEWTVVSNRRKQKSAESGKRPSLKIDASDVNPELEYWASAISCYVLGANPPSLVLRGFIRRIWNNLAISSIASQPNGVYLIRFKTKEDKQRALQSGPLFFDNKPFIVKDWTPGMKIVKDKPVTVPVWIRLYDLDIKYWGLALPKIVGLVGKPICSDQATKDKEYLGFARYLVEVKVGEQLPDTIEFIDEHDICQTQQVHYEWKPVSCNLCHGIGHETGLCKKKPVKAKPKIVQQVWKPKVPVPQAKVSEKIHVPQQAKSRQPDVVLPQLQPHMVVTPMPYQGSMLNSLTPARFLNRLTKKGEGISSGPTFVDVLSYSIRKNLLNSMGKGPSSQHINGLFGLVETKVRTNNITSVQDGLGNKWNFLNNNDIHESGRIWLLWDPSLFHVVLLMKDKQAIHVSVDHLQSGYSWTCSIIYGCNKDSERTSLWERIGSEVTLAEIRDFQQCVDSCGLYDLVNQGAYFTWNNKQEENKRVFSRIDRVLANDLWIDSGPSGIASFLPEGLFDHSPCIIRLWDESARKPSCFKYFNMWGKDERFHKDHQGCPGKATYRGCKSFQVVKKLKMLKYPLKQLNKEGFGDIINTTKVAHLLLKDIQKKLHQDPQNILLQNEERAAAISYKELSEARDMFLNQKAKVQWMKCNDENTQFFHSSIKARRALNKILTIKDQNGVLCSDNKSIENAFLTYYKDLLGSSKEVTRVNLGVVRRGKCITHQQASAMTQRISDVEIKEALFDIPIDKAPGPDGYTSCFFKDSFDITDDLLLFCKGNTGSVKILMRAMLTFSLASGLTINSNKSDVYMNGVPILKPLTFSNITGFHQGSFPFRYLGIDISYKRLTNYQCNKLVDKMVLRIRSWGAKKLSYAGRLILVKTVLSQLHCYWARIFLLPKGILNRVTIICRNYLWSGDNEYHRVLQCPGRVAARIKLKEVRELPIASSGMWPHCQIHRWIANKKDSLRVRWVHHIYIKRVDGGLTLPPVNSSWVWRQFVSAWHPFVWNRLCLPKVNFISWLFAKNKLLHIGEYLVGLHWISFSLEDMLHWKFGSLLKKQIAMAGIASLIYNIWVCRNSAKHDGCIPRPHRVLQQVQSMVKFRLQVIKSEAKLQKSRPWLEARNLLIC